MRLFRVHRERSARLLILLMALMPFSLSGAAKAHDPQDLILEKIGVDERLGAALPLELSFTDQKGEKVRLSRIVQGVPAIVTLNYFSCPTLCPLVFRNLARTVNQMRDLSPGRDFRVAAVSIDPGERLGRAREKSTATYRMLDNFWEPERNWPFLFGSREAIDRLAGSVGIRYTRVGKNEFAHPNVLVVVTPQGRISRYLYGIEQSPRDLKLALVEAASGRIGTSQLLNRALLYCFHYDPVGKKYVLFASRLMTGAMIAILAVFVGVLAFLWRRERSKTRGGTGPLPPT